MIQPRFTTRQVNKIKQFLRPAIILTGLVLLGQIIWQIDKTPSQNNLISDFSPDPTTIIEEKYRNWPHKVDNIEVTPNMIILTLDNRVQVTLSKQKPLDKQLEALQLIINQSKINGRMPKEVDLRFNNPIATY